jgi:hypothetical protein
MERRTHGAPTFKSARPSMRRSRHSKKGEEEKERRGEERSKAATPHHCHADLKVGAPCVRRSMCVSDGRVADGSAVPVPATLGARVSAPHRECRSLPCQHRRRQVAADQSGENSPHSKPPFEASLEIDAPSAQTLFFALRSPSLPALRATVSRLAHADAAPRSPSPADAPHHGMERRLSSRLGSGAAIAALPSLKKAWWLPRMESSAGARAGQSGRELVRTGIKTKKLLTLTH